MAVLDAVRTLRSNSRAPKRRVEKDRLSKPSRFDSLEELNAYARRVVMTEVDHVVRERVSSRLRNRRSRRAGAYMMSVLTPTSRRYEMKTKISSSSRVADLKMRFERRTPQAKELRPGTLYLLYARAVATRRGRTHTCQLSVDAFVALVYRYDAEKREVTFKMTSGDAAASGVVTSGEPVVGLTSYKRMFDCKLNKLMGRSSELSRCVLGLPKPKHIFFDSPTKPLRRSPRRKRIRPVMSTKATPPLNKSQEHVVATFMDSASCPLRICHGPPGTGKSKMIVELLMRLTETKSEARVVVCAPSNKAVQVLIHMFLSSLAQRQGSSVVLAKRQRRCDLFSSSESSDESDEKDEDEDLRSSIEDDRNHVIDLTTNGDNDFDGNDDVEEVRGRPRGGSFTHESTDESSDDSDDESTEDSDVESTDESSDDSDDAIRSSRVRSCSVDLLPVTRNSTNAFPSVVLVGVDDPMIVREDLRCVFVHHAHKLLVEQIDKADACLCDAASSDESFLRHALESLLTLRRLVRERSPSTFAKRMVVAPQQNEASASRSSSPHKRKRRKRISVSALINRTIECVQELVDSSAGGLALFMRIKRARQQCDLLSSEIKRISASDIEFEFVNRARVVFCTLACAGRTSMIRRDPCDYLIVDECAQAVEAEALVALQTLPRRVLLVGDPNQLSAMAQSPIAKRAGYERSLMQRLMDSANVVDVSLLDTQYRMRPEISAFPNAHFYDSKVRESDLVLSARWDPVWSGYGAFTNVVRTSTEDMPPYFVVDVAKGRERNVGGSFANDAEASIVPNVVSWVRGRREKSTKRERTTRASIVVITFYRSQVDVIRSKLKEGGVTADCVVSTVDSFQGSEADVVVLSCVRANSTHRVGFLSEFRRLNVALTRAKRGLIVLCHATTLENGRSDDLKALVCDAKRRGVVFTAC